MEELRMPMKDDDKQPAAPFPRARVSFETVTTSRFAKRMHAETTGLL
jgi:hypothetical protein